MENKRRRREDGDKEDVTEEGEWHGGLEKKWRRREDGDKEDKKEEAK